MGRTKKRRRKVYETTRRFPTRFKTTTKQGKREYMRWYMRKKRGTPPSRYWKRGPRPKKRKKAKK